MTTPPANLASFGRTLLSGLLQLIYPNVCWTCGNLMPAEQQHVCSVCLPALTVDPFPTCPRCSSTVGPHVVFDEGCPDCRAESFAFDGAFRMAPYEGLLRETILRMKQWTGEDLAEVIGSVWAKTMAARLAPLAPDAVVPVPLHWTRRWQRGFNSCEILARCLAQELGTRFVNSCLRRTRATARQTHQPNATARRDNVKRAFDAIGGEALAGKTLFLVDDVLTTGSTANEAARALRLHKPKAIYVIVLAHGR